MARTVGAQQDPNGSADDTGANAFVLPEGIALAEARLVQAGSDLLVSGPDGGDVLLRDFFAADGPPDLVSPGGVRMAGSLVATLADTETPIALADALLGAGVDPAGKVAALNGALYVVRADGSHAMLSVGDPIYPGDILESEPGGAASISVEDQMVVSLGGGGRMIFNPGAFDPSALGAPVVLAAGPGEYAFACGATPRPMIVDTSAGRIHSDGAEFVLTYLDDGGLRVILLPTADGTVGDVLIENEAGSLHMTLAYQLVLVHGAAMAPASHGVLDTGDIIAGYGRILASLPSGCDSNPLVAAARMAELERADLAGDSGDLSDADLRALAEFETAAGDEATGDATFGDSKVVVTQQDPLAGDDAESVTDPQVSADTRTAPSNETGSPGDRDGNSNEIFLSGQATVVDAPRSTFPEPPGVRPPIQEDLTVGDWDAGLQEWKVLVPQEPTEYGKGTFYRKPEQYDEPKPFVFLPLSIDDIAGQYFPTSGENLVLMSAGPLNEARETGRGAEVEDIEHRFFGMPVGTLPDDTDGTGPVDGAAMKTTVQVHSGDSIRFDWMFDARDQVTGVNGGAADDYAVFIADGEWYRLSGVRDTGSFGASGWRTSEWIYTGAGAKTVAIGFALLNDFDDANEPRLLIDDVRLNKPISADHQEIGDTQEKGVGALRTFVLPPTANDDPDAIATTEDAAVIIRVADLLANDSDPNALRTLSITSLDSSGTSGTVKFRNPETIIYDPNSRYEALTEGDGPVSDSFRYEIANPSGGHDTAVVTVTITGVNDAPTSRDIDIGAEEDGPSVTGNFAGQDLDSDDGPETLTYTLTGSPSEGSVAVNGVGGFAFDPGSNFQDLAAGQTRDVTFTYTATDRHGATSDPATITVSISGANDAPTAADVQFNAMEDDPPVTIDFAAADIDSDDDRGTLTYTLTRPPSEGSAAVNGAGSFIFDPGSQFEHLGVGDSQAVTFAYTAADRHGAASGEGTVTVTIAGANDAPMANAFEGSTDEDAGLFSVDLLNGAITSDVDVADVLAITSVAQNTGASDWDLGGAFTLDGGVFSFDTSGFGELAEGKNATVVFDFIVDDQREQSNSTAASTLKIAVEGRNDAPTAGDDAYTVSEDDAWTETAANGLLANDRDVDAGDSLRISAVNGISVGVGSRLELTSGAFITVNTGGSFTYDQNGRFDGLRRGDIATDSFEYTVSDNHGGTDTGTVTIRIVGLNDVPRATDDTLTVGEDVIVPATASISVLDNDGDSESGFLSVTPFEGTSVLGARVTMAEDGFYSYDPTVSPAIQALSDGETLTDSFVYDLNDGDGGVDSGTVTITVEGANDAPEASDVSFRTFKGSTLQVDSARGVLLNDTDLDGSDVPRLTAINGEAANVGSEIAMSSGALLTVNADGTFSYDPNGRFDGLGDEDTATDGFTYTVSDGAGLTDTATVTVTVTGFKEQVVGSFDQDLTVWNSAGSVNRIVHHVDPENEASRFLATDGPRMAVLEANGASVSEIETALGLPSSALPNDTDLTSPVDGGATWTEVSVRTGDRIHFDWNFDSSENIAANGPNDFAVFTVSNGAVSRVFKLSDAREIGGSGASGWRTFSYDPTDDFDVDTAGESLTIGFAVVNDQNADNPSRLLVDNVRIAWELPAPVNDAFAVNADVPLVADPGRNLLANDRDTSDTGTLTVSAVNPTDLDDGTANVGAPITLASGAVLTVNADGTFALDPSSAADLRSLAESEIYIDGFTYSVADGNDRSGLGTASVEITFVGVNDKPIAGDDGAFTDAHSTVRITTERLLANDSDPDGGDSLTITAVDDGATTGTVTLGNDGLILYDPGGHFLDLAPGEEALDTFGYTLEDEQGGSSTATVTVRVLGQADPLAPLGQIVTSFETFPPGGWDPEWDRIKPFASEPVSIVTEYRETDGAGGDFKPTGGDQMVVLEAYGSFANPATSVTDFLGVPALPSDSDGTRAADGSAMKTTIAVKVGDEISFDWMFDARDQSAGGGQVFNDYAVLTISGPDGPEVFKLADVRQTGDFGASGWRTSSYLAASDGELTAGFAVMNDAVSHGSGDPRNSKLLVDNVRLGREFGDGYQRLNGEPGDRFQTWVQPPRAADDTASTTEDTPLTIAAGDLLANDSPPNVGGPIGVIDVDASRTLGVVTQGVDGAIGYDPRGAFETLRAGETATDTFQYTVGGENGGTARASVSITVHGANDAPVAQGDNVATDEDTAVAGNVLADNGDGEDADVDGDNLTVVRVNGAAANVGSQIALVSGALLLVNADGTFSYDPDGRFEFLGPDDAVTDTFTYTVDDGQGGTATATVSVLVAGINDAPVANDDASSTNEDTAVTIDLIGNDFDAETAAPAITGLNDSATVGLLTPNGDGTVTYDPSGRFDSLAAGEVATDTFSYTIEDGMGGADVATVTVEVAGVNDAPVANNDGASTSELAPVTIAVLGNDVDAEGDSLTVAGLDDSGAIGLVALNGDGTVTYDPNGRFDTLADGETATDTFSYTVSDGNGLTDVATVTVTISGVDDGGAGGGELVESFEGPIDPASKRGAVSPMFQYDEPDGAKGEFSPTDGNSMAVLRASGASSLSIEFFLGLSDPLPADFGDSSNPADGSALKLTIDVEDGDRISFDWLFDANDFVQPPLGDFARPGFNDFAVFTADGEWFNLSDVRQTFDESGDHGATGWRTSIYTARSDGPLTIGFAVVNDDTADADSHLLVDNLRINRDFDSESYTIVRSDPSGLLDTVVRNPDV